MATGVEDCSWKKYFHSHEKGENSLASRQRARLGWICWSLVPFSLLAALWEDESLTWSLGSVEKEVATHSSVLAWRIPGTGEAGGLLSMGLHRVGHDWSDLAAVAGSVEAVSWSICPGAALLSCDVGNTGHVLWLMLPQAMWQCLCSGSCQKPQVNLSLKLHSAPPPNSRLRSNRTNISWQEKRLGGRYYIFSKCSRITRNLINGRNEIRQGCWLWGARPSKEQKCLWE